MPKTVYIVVGPTAVGKTSFAISLAKQLHTEIISADARQCFRELNIGVARPSVNELSAVPHHFIASHSIHDQVNASVFEKYAIEKTEHLFKQHDSIVMVGGTGLYVQAFCEGLDNIPSIDPSIREQIIVQYKREGIAWLQQQVAENDPLFWEQAEKTNPQRLMRALEVIKGTGVSIIRFQNKNKVVRPFKIVKIGLEMPRAELYQRINERALEMVKMGLEEEVRSLLSFFHLNALQTVGYREWLGYFDHMITKQRVIELIQLNTRHYAKRQMTWFKKDLSIQWFQSSLIKPSHIL